MKISRNEIALRVTYMHACMKHGNKEQQLVHVYQQMTIEQQQENKENRVPSCVLILINFTTWFGSIQGRFRITTTILGLDDSKGSQIVPHYRPCRTSRASQSSPITGYEWKGFNLSGSILRAHTEVDTSRELATCFP